MNSQQSPWAYPGPITWGIDKIARSKRGEFPKLLWPEPIVSENLHAKISSGRSGMDESSNALRIHRPLGSRFSVVEMCLVFILSASTTPARMASSSGCRSGYLRLGALTMLANAIADPPLRALGRARPVSINGRFPERRVLGSCLGAHLPYLGASITSYLSSSS